MKTCHFFGRCGGCRLDVAAADYRTEKLRLLGGVKPDEVVWITDKRRRAEFAFLGSKIGFFARGSNDIVPIDRCPLLDGDINVVLRGLPAPAGGGSVLVTKCENGVAVDFNSAARLHPPELKRANAARVTWNGRIVKDGGPMVFGRPFMPNGFLQPTVGSERVLQSFAAAHARGRIADLFCGIGTLTIGMNADGFDAVARGRCRARDLFRRPLSAKELEKYDSIVVDPPRAGAKEQCGEIAKTSKPVVHVSCNPETWLRDGEILRAGGYECVRIAAIDQFAGSSHWELATAFAKK